MDIQSQCRACNHLDRSGNGAPSCSAFEEGIPEEIWMNRHDHHEPYPGDEGIRFELATVPEHAPEAEKVTAS